MDPNAPVKKSRSPVFYIAIGCGGLMLLMLGVVLVGMVLLKQGFDSVKEGINDPAKKAANVQKMLGASPPGYYPVMTLSVPMLMDMALLSDREPPTDGGAADFDRGFMYFRVIATEQSTKVKDFFDGKDDDTTALKGSGINVDAKDVLKRGALKTANGTAAKFVATRGTMETQGRGKHQGQSGLNTLIYFECTGDTALHLGVWMMKDPSPETAADKLELAGTVADQAEVGKFIAPLTPCGK